MDRWLCAPKRILPALVCCTLLTLQTAAAEIPTVRCGDREQNRIAITMDDCYDSDHVLAAVESVGYMSVVKWDVNQTDADEALRDAQSGSILLYHARAKDIRCLRKLIPRLLERGHECVTVSGLLGLEAVVPSEDIYLYDARHAVDPSLLP